MKDEKIVTYNTVLPFTTAITERIEATDMRYSEASDFLG